MLTGKNSYFPFPRNKSALAVTILLNINKIDAIIRHPFLIDFKMRFVYIR